VLLAYDGSELARLAIEEAGRQLAPGREAFVLCVWQPADVGFVPVEEQHFDAQNAVEVERAAQQTADQGAALAERAGFRARGLVAREVPTWKGIVAVAEEHHVSLIVLGHHRRSGIVGHLLGSVTAAVEAHTTVPLLVVQQQT
jgi:nucleotide-binding universal stress UspA family protein